MKELNIDVLSFEQLLREGAKLTASSREDPRPSTIMLIGLSQDCSSKQELRRPKMSMISHLNLVSG